MSWDLTVLNIVDGSRSIDEIRDNSLESLGSRETISSKLMQVFPEINNSDPEWLVFRDQGYSLEFSLGSDHMLDSFMIHVHGNDDQAVNAIERLCRHTGWSILDAAIGDLINFEKKGAQEGYLRWRNYKDRVQNRSIDAQ